MQRALLIKLTSLGDLIHALPALSDAQDARPGIEFDWVIDENFQEIATWHPAVKGVITTNHREWRGAVTSSETHGSIGKTIEQMRSRPYDLVIDGQGNFKTALLSLFSKGPRAGFDAASVREWVAHLDYPLPSSEPDFRIQRERFVRPKVELPDNYLVFIHNASWKTKLWPERHWTDLIGKCADAGFHVLLPWGNSQEEARAKRLAKRAQVLPKLTLSEIGYVLANARACVSMDTGLSHLAAALDVPSITLYGSTDSGLIGASGASQVHIKSERFCSPCQSKTCRYSSGDNPCLEEIGPDRVFGELLRLTGPALKPVPVSPVSAAARRAS